MTFEVLNAHTGKPFTDDEKIKIAREHKMIYCDIDQFFIGEDGQVILTDECGNFAFMNPNDVIVKRRKTNLEKLVEMDSKEMTNTIFGRSCAYPCGICEYSDYEHCANNDCVDGVRLWLDQEVDDERR